MKLTEKRIQALSNKWREHLKSEKKAPLYLNFYGFLKSEIHGHEFPFNCELPATRELAERFSISRSTAVKVYELLKIDGLLESKSGSGHTVIFQQKADDFIKFKKRTKRQDISELGKSFYQNVNLVNTIDDKLVAFRPGLPPLDIFPITSWRKQANKYWQFIKSSELTYYSESGVEPLRTGIANYLNITRSIKCSPDQIMVVGGSLQSLFLIGSLLIDPRDTILVENPTFPNVHSVYKGLRANINGVNIDDEGMNIDELIGKRFRKLKLVHVTPSCHYPFGVKMTLDRKHKIIDFARAKGSYIIENDYEYEINNAHMDSPSLFSLDREDRTFYIGTFNRILHPSIRIGYMVVPRSLVLPMKALMRHSHLFVSPSNQFMMSSFIEGKHLQKHLDVLNKVVAQRYKIFLNAIQKDKANSLEILPFHTPSLQLTGLLKRDLSDQKIVANLKANGIMAHALSKCYISEPKQGLVFGHSSVRHQTMQTHLNTLLKTLSNQ